MCCFHDSLTTPAGGWTPRMRDRAAKLTFFARNALLAFGVIAGKNPKKSKTHTDKEVRMTLVNRLSVVAAYVAFAFVGAIILGVF
jgi:hypothetical protein